MSDQNLTVTLPTFPHDRLSSWGSSLSFLIMALGLLFSLWLFYISHNEVDSVLANQMTAPINQRVSEIKSLIDRDEVVIGSLAGYWAVDQALREEDIRQFLKASGLENHSIRHVFIAKIERNEAHLSPELLSFGPSDSTPFRPASLQGLFGLIRYVALTERPSTVVLQSQGGLRTSWFVVAQPIKTREGQHGVLIGFSLVEDVINNLLILKRSGIIHALKIREDTGALKAPFFEAADLTVWTDRFLAISEREARIPLRDRSWLIRYSVRVTFKTLPLILLPYMELTIALLLTVALALYVRMARRRGQEIENLAISLRQANEELNRRVNDEKRMVQIIQSSEKRYRTLFDNAGIGICQVNFSGKWVNANKTIATILGYGSVQALLDDQPDLHGRMFVDPHQRREWFERLAEGVRREFEAQVYTKDVSTIWVSLSGRVIGEIEGECDGYEFTMYDITERRRFEFALIKAKEQADFANRSKTEFLANMSHELRTPLNAIIGFSEIIKDQIFGVVGQMQYVEYANDIYDSGQLLLSLINDILDMSKIEAGKRALHESVLDIDRIVQSVMRLITSRAKLGKLRLDVNVADELPMLYGEEKAIKQIITNVFTNAIKFTPEGGAITFNASVDDQKRLLIKISDTGIGIAPNDIPLALAPFGQIASSLSRKHQGTGLGLPLTKALVELHGGILDLSSEVGVGTTVSIVFPADRVIPKKTSQLL